MTGGPEGLALVSTIINLAHSLKLKVVAEGVETEEQSRMLRLLDCDEMQGYVFSPPLASADFEARFPPRRVTAGGYVRLRTDARAPGSIVRLHPGGTAMNTKLKIAVALAAATLATHAAAQVVFYEHDDFQGRSFSSRERINNFERSGFNDRASSVVVVSGRWEACEHAQFGGQCIVLRPGRYRSLNAMGMNDRVSSVRMLEPDMHVEERRYAPQPMPVYDNSRRRDERIYSADVTSVRAVVGPPTERCWVEHQQVESRGGPNVPAPSSARSWAACSATRSAAGAAMTSPPQAAP
jgi:hypothetical protein